MLVPRRHAREKGIKTRECESTPYAVELGGDSVIRVPCVPVPVPVPLPPAPPAQLPPPRLVDVPSPFRLVPHSRGSLLRLEPAKVRQVVQMHARERGDALVVEREGGRHGKRGVLNVLVRRRDRFACLPPISWESARRTVHSPRSPV